MLFLLLHPNQLGIMFSKVDGALNVEIKPTYGLESSGKFLNSK
jgi:hypothetical protein